MNLDIFLMEAMVKVDDTLPGIEEGLNCNMWTISLALTGKEVGQNHAEVRNALADELKRKLERAYGRMAQCGAHSVVDGIWDVPAGLDDISARVRRGERP